jgi:hypothetical protein
MKTLSLAETNPYLKDPVKRLELIERSVRTSGGVEGIKVIGRSKSAHIVIPRREDKKIYKLIKPTAQTK